MEKDCNNITNNTDINTKWIDHINRLEGQITNMWNFLA